MKALLCASMETAERVVSTALVLLQLREPPELVLLHVRDTSPQKDLEQVRLRFTGRGGLGASHAAQIALATQAVAEDILREACELCLAAGYRADRVTTLLRAGRPEHEIVRVAQEMDVDLVVVGNRDRLVDPHGKPRPASGPGSIGHVARFVVDHAPCPVLLLRA